MRKWLALLLFPLAVQAAGEGAWQDSGMGVTLNYRGVSASSSPLSARQPVSGV
ncbi:flagellar protein FlhE, partial [Salmonella enterica subsp. enterica serovar Agona]|nr:flagellar protein FlhE [Salmonella enterica subsp. enterica serovar Agona]